jgi:Cyclin, C-terminal domain
MELVELSKSLKFIEEKQFFTEYGKEILNTIFEAERHNLHLEKASEQLGSRSQLLELMLQFSNHQEYSLATLYLGKFDFFVKNSGILLRLFEGVYFLDVYMDGFVISDSLEHQKLIALIALILAAKSEDIDETIPSIKDLLNIVDMSSDLGVDLRFKSELDKASLTKAYKGFATIYCSLEYLIFENLKFNTCRPTVISFINIFQNIVVVELDLQEINAQKEPENHVNFGDLCVSSKMLMKQFLDLIIFDIDFFNLLPSLLASSIIGATRTLLHIKTIWNEDLVSLTRYSEEEITPLVNILIEKKHEADSVEEVEETNEMAMCDSGYISPQNETPVVLKQPSKKRKMENRPGIIHGIL